MKYGKLIWVITQYSHYVVKLAVKLNKGLRNVTLARFAFEKHTKVFDFVSHCDG